MLTPDKMVGWDTQRSKEENIYMSTKYQNLSVYGGGKKDANYESIISSNPDIILMVTVELLKMLIKYSRNLAKFQPYMLKGITT